MGTNYPVNEYSVEQEIRDFQRAIPDLSQCYEDIKSRFIQLRIDFVYQRRKLNAAEKEIRQLTEKLKEAERLNNQMLFNKIKQSEPDEMLCRQEIVGKFLGRD